MSASPPLSQSCQLLLETTSYVLPSTCTTWKMKHANENQSSIVLGAFVHLLTTIIYMINHACLRASAVSEDDCSIFLLPTKIVWNIENTINMKNFIQLADSCSSAFGKACENPNNGFQLLGGCPCPLSPLTDKHCQKKPATAFSTPKKTTLLLG